MLAPPPTAGCRASLGGQALTDPRIAGLHPVSGKAPTATTVAALPATARPRRRGRAAPVNGRLERGLDGRSGPRLPGRPSRPATAPLTAGVCLWRWPGTQQTSALGSTGGTAAMN